MRNGATHHIIIPQYPSGNQTGQFAASYCHPEPEHSRPVLKKWRQNEQKLKGVNQQYSSSQFKLMIEIGQKISQSPTKNSQKVCLFSDSYFIQLDYLINEWIQKLAAGGRGVGRGQVVVSIPARNYFLTGRFSF